MRTLYYIWLNDAHVGNWYWSQTAQNWVNKAGAATKFLTQEEANAEAEYAEVYNRSVNIKAEVVVGETNVETH